MEKRTWKITLADGTSLDGLNLNGNNFISSTAVTEDTFAGKLSSVTIEGPDGTEIHEDMKRTLQQEQALTEENQRLKDRKEQLISPDAVEKQAREQFGLAEPGEIPYRR